MRRHRSAFAQQLAQGAALDELHHEEDVIAVLALVVDRDEPGMRQSRDGSGLELEPCQELGIGGELRIHDLHGDGTVETHVGAAVDGRHAAPRDLRFDAITPVEHDADQSVASSGHPVYPRVSCVMVGRRYPGLRGIDVTKVRLRVCGAISSPSIVASSCGR